VSGPGAAGPAWIAAGPVQLKRAGPRRLCRPPRKHRAPAPPIFAQEVLTVVDSRVINANNVLSAQVMARFVRSIQNIRNIPLVNL
jgi:hypothetical protein